MRSMLAVAAVAVVFGLPGTQVAAAQDTKNIRGDVRATAPNAVTVEVGDNEMTFKVDSATLVTARGGSVAMQQARAAGKSGVPYTEIVKVGHRVEVAYHEAGMHAATIRVVPGGPRKPRAAAAPAPRATNAAGIVTAVSDTLFTIRSGSDELTFAVDGQTKVSGRGLGTQAREMERAGEKPVFGEFVHKGDNVQVRYEEASGTNHATEVRVTRKSS